MEKRNELREGVSVCDRCSKPVAHIASGGKALCTACRSSAVSSEKTAEAVPAEVPLKSLPPELGKSID